MAGWLWERFGLRVPLIGAPMAGVAGGRLAAAISGAGALGMIGVGGAATGDWIAEQAGLARAAGRPFGIGLMAWVVERNPEQLAAVLAAGPDLVSVSFGDYRRRVAPLHDAGITVATQVGTVAEARQAEDAGVDLIVARGGEGGGHGRDAVATLPLVQAVLAAVDAPVVAAGGIASAGGLAAVLAAGAVGGWAGTAFLGCPEGLNTPAARERVMAASETDTAYGRVFDVAQRNAWPDGYGGRALRNAFFDRWAGHEDELAGAGDARAELLAARDRADFDTAYIYAGQAVGMVTAQRDAATVVADFARAVELLRTAARRHAADA